MPTSSEYGEEMVRLNRESELAGYTENGNYNEY